MDIINRTLPQYEKGVNVFLDFVFGQGNAKQNNLLSMTIINLGHGNRV